MPIKVVIDTSVLYAAAAPYQVEELKALAPAQFVIPFTALSELDRLMERIDKRDRARKALNAIEDLVARGAGNTPVPCGDGLTIVLGRAGDECAYVGLDPVLADDRILACAVTLSEEKGQAVSIATTEFGLYAKALAWGGIGGLYLKKYAETRTTITRREQARLDQAWNRLLLASDTWSVCRRGLIFLGVPAVKQLLDAVRSSNEPSAVAQIVRAFDLLSEKWVEDVNITSVLHDCLGLAPAPAVNYATLVITEPAIFGLGANYHPAVTRRETPDEKRTRIAREEATQRGQEEFIVDWILSWLGTVRDYVMEQVRED